MSNFLTKFGQTILYRVSDDAVTLPTSLVEDMIGEALGRLSDDENLELSKINICRDECRMQFFRMSPAIFKDCSVLMTRQRHRLDNDEISGGIVGAFQRCDNFVGSYVISITPVTKASESSATSLKPARTKIIPKQPVVDPNAGGEAASRRKELYKSLFDETIDENDTARAQVKVLSSDDRRPVNRHEKRLHERDVPDKSQISRSSQSRLKTVGSTKDKILLVDEQAREKQASKRSKRSCSDEYVPEFLGDRRKRVKASEPSEYVPTKLSEMDRKNERYVPTAQKSTQLGSVHYEPSRKPSSVEEYIPKKISRLPADQTAREYNPRRGDKIRKGRIDVTENEPYEPPGNISMKSLHYEPSKVSPVPTSEGDSFGLRTVRRKVSPATLPASTSQRGDVRGPCRRAEGPEKCFVPEELRNDQEQALSIDCVPAKNVELEHQISRLKSLTAMTEDQIEYLFHRFADEVAAIATRNPRRKRHDLFMADQRDVLNKSIPMTAVTQEQIVQIRRLCLERFKVRLGFNVFYIMQVLLPEVIIRLHMAVHGTTFKQSDRLTDMQLVDMNEAHRKLVKASKRLMV